jgi:predicted O-linked N-acetylglucosamine transferase (SPINDLY family)
VNDRAPAAWQTVSSDDADFTADVLKAWRGQLDLPGLFSQAARLESGGRRELAAVLYQTWLSRNDTPFTHFAQFNLGTVLVSAGDLDGARRAYLRAIELSPSFLQPRFNLGMVYERLEQPEAAIQQWAWIADHAAADRPEEQALRKSALNNLGRVYELHRQYAQALSCLTKSLEIDPAQGDVLHHWIFLRARQCEWPVYTPVANVDPQLMRRSTSALAMIALSDDPEAQLDAARHYVRDKVNLAVPALSGPGSYRHRKLRVAYLSSDLCLHPIGLLTAELFELHDRDEFEVFAYCWTREDGSPLRRRIIAALDHFVRIDALSDEAAARRIRDDEIDVLIDLHGQTLGARPNLLAWRPAPIQITYLGLPATTGFPFIDYVIADRFLVPEDAVRFYSEKPLYMPEVYQVSDRKRNCAPVPTRESCGLPGDAFVYCSFNNSFKYTPDVFALWMDILRRVPASVLWLLADNPWAEANLRKEAMRHGMDAGRLVFAGRVAPDVYLARYGVADLFLDTYPFNAGTTANDALWMGLPVLTLSGRTFASRMAGALLTAAGLPELIACSPGEYVEKAVALARSADDRQRLLAHLGEVREHGALFDTPRFVRNLEAHFRRLAGNLDG